MRRFAKNRWWAFVLTLCVLLASSASLTSQSFADGGNDDVVIGDPSVGGGGEPGDPDGTGGPGKRWPTGGRRSAGGSHYAVTPVGDGGTAMRVWSWRLHVVLRSLISRYSR